MADRLPTDAELDALINSVLSDEPMLPVPRGLHQKIHERVTIAALQERERLRFRNTLLTALGALLVLLTGTTMVVTLTNFSLLYHHGISGGMGLIDYYLNRFDVSWSGHVGTYALLISVGLSAVSLWGGLVLFRMQTRLAPIHGHILQHHAVDASMRQTR